MVSNRRRGESSIPDNYEKLLTTEQLEALRKLESFGWSVNLVRRPKFEPVQVVLIHSDDKSYAVLTETGELDHKTPPQLRDELVIPDTGDENGDPWANATDDMEFEVSEAPEPPPAATVGNEPVPTSSKGGVTKSNKRPPKDILV